MNIPGGSWKGGLLLVCVFFPAAAAGGEGLSLLAEQVAAAGTALGVRRYAIEEFRAGDGASQAEAAEAKTGFAQELNDREEAQALDAALLAGLGRGKAWPQAVVQGTIFGSGEGRTLVIKIKDRGGRNLMVYQLDMPAGRPPPPDLRDAPDGMSACGRRGRALALANRALVDLKARYWAARVRLPGFSYEELAAPPGSELSEYPVIQQFYARLNAYYEQDGPVTLTPGERKQIEALLEKEAAYAAECAGTGSPDRP